MATSNGVYSASVVDNRDPDGLARVLVRVSAPTGVIRGDLMTELLIIVSHCTTPLKRDMPALTVSRPALTSVRAISGEPTIRPEHQAPRRAPAATGRMPSLEPRCAPSIRTASRARLPCLFGA